MKIVIDKITKYLSRFYRIRGDNIELKKTSDSQKKKYLDIYKRILYEYYLDKKKIGKYINNYVVNLLHPYF